jgi:hypothetical protein
MGLGVTAYSRLVSLDAVFNADGEPINPKTRKRITGRYIQVFANPYFEARIKPQMDKQCYRHSGSFYVRPGPYSTYNRWREELAKFSGWPAVDDENYGRITKSHQRAACEATSGKFWELLCFSDCEGWIGTKACKKLAKDFAEVADNAKEHPDESWRDLYAEWQKAFELAADDGGVCFH